MAPTWKSTLVVPSGGAGNWANQCGTLPGPDAAAEFRAEAAAVGVPQDEVLLLALLVHETRPGNGPSVRLRLRVRRSRQSAAIQSLPPVVASPLPETVTKPPWSRVAEVTASVSPRLLDSPPAPLSEDGARRGVLLVVAAPFPRGRTTRTSVLGPPSSRPAAAGHREDQPGRDRHRSQCPAGRHGAPNIHRRGFLSYRSVGQMHGEQDGRVGKIAQLEIIRVEVEGSPPSQSNSTAFAGSADGATSQRGSMTAVASALRASTPCRE